MSRLFYLQITRHGFYAALARGQQTVSQDIQPKRGEIFMKDKDGNLQVLAQNKDWKMVYAIPREIKDPEKAARSLAPILNVSEDDILARLKDQESSYKIISRRLDPDRALKILQFKFKGIYETNDPGRYYPNGRFGAHLLGFLGYRDDEKIGQYGLEGYYDKILSGSQGRIFAEKDAFGNLIGVIKRGFAWGQDGQDLVLSIDPNIQYQTEGVLEDFFEKLKAEGGTIIVSDPTTGKIMALANSPDFDPNKYFEENLEIFSDAAVQKLFEPGSILKPITMAAAIDAGKISPGTVYFDTGEVQIGGYTIQNFDKKSHGEQTMTQVLEKSLNTGAVFAERQLGNDLFRKYLEAFGFSSKTGIDLEGEVAGNIKNLYAPYEINFATASFGQGVALTPIQIITAFSAIANQGKTMKPYIVEKMVNGNGAGLEVKPQVIFQVLSAKAALQITSMLVSVVDNGFSKKAGIPGYFVAAKTGTAQVPSTEGRGYTDKVIHSFIGFAPAFSPKFLIFIKLDNPRGINFAADSIAPAFAKLAKYILDYYEIPPER